MAGLNVALSPVENLLAQIALDNPADPNSVPPYPGFTATPDLLSIGAPQVMGSADGQGRNTQVVITTIPGKASGGPWVLSYRRLALREALQGYAGTPVVYTLQASELDANQVTVLDLEVTLGHVLMTLFGTGPVGLQPDFSWGTLTGWVQRPTVGFVTNATLVVAGSALTLVDSLVIPVQLIWPVRPIDKSMTDLAVTALNGYALH